ncbi:ArsR family transcriptional regulator [Ectothiorhodospira mobilis]|uniref:ArsR family transcriptional regulator n=2 Tax=Ectothiorhodospira mobilis TaxID=195064 RepID=A0A1I4RWX2_ECTMO|nr:ArsR family transcriptional regulator [Ectothiorhodospira mobilis]
MQNDEYVMSPSDLFHALSHDTRLRLVLLMTEHGRLCVCQLQHAVDEDQPSISRHLAILRKAGLIVGERRAQWVDYQLAPHLPAWVHQVLETTLAAAREQSPFREDRLRLTHMSVTSGLGETTGTALE